MDIFRLMCVDPISSSVVPLGALDSRSINGMLVEMLILYFRALSRHRPNLWNPTKVTIKPLEAT